MKTKYVTRCARFHEAEKRFESWLEFGKQVAEVRKLNELTQIDLANAMRANGEKVTSTEISRIENGVLVPNDDRRTRALMLALRAGPRQERRLRHLRHAALRDLAG